MCIIVHKPQDAKLDWDLIKNCMDNNPHGAGVALVNGGVVIDKGYFDFDDLRDNVGAGCDAHECVLHFRIATSGTVDAGSTHPFPLSRDLEVIRALNITADRAIVHNGITSYGKKEELETTSDTMLLVRDVLSRISNPKRLDRTVRKLAAKTHGRFALVTPKGVKRFGTGWTWNEGVCYSNTSYNAFHYAYYYQSFSSWEGGSWRCEWCGRPALYGNLCRKCKKALDSYEETFLCDWCGKTKNIALAVEVYDQYLLCPECVIEWKRCDEEEATTKALQPY